MRWVLATSVALWLGSTGCGQAAAPRPQWLVVISTDAIVPQFGDQILVELLSPDGGVCDACQRYLDGSAPDKWPVSFGIEPAASSSGLRVHAQLFRTVLHGPMGLTSDRIIDALVPLPTPVGVQEVDVPLAMQCFGILADLANNRTCDPSTGALVDASTLGATRGLQVGTWEPGIITALPPDAPSGMVPIPGGAFLMGDPTYLPAGDLDPVPEQLVTLPSFYLDEYEVTVGQMRSLASPADLPTMGAGTATGCTFTAVAGGAEGMPVNCISQQKAASFCASQGKRLPTEAEWEWAAGNLGRETPFPWNDGGDPCSNAIIAAEDPEMASPYTDSCETSMNGPGVRAGGNPLDVTASGLVNMAGNVSEWVADSFSPYASTPCWGPDPTLRVNPRCAIAGAAFAVRGGSWQSEVTQARVTARAQLPGTSEAVDVGFRCAK